MNDKVKISSGKGFKFITNFVIHESTQQRITLDFKYIPDKDKSLHHVALEITKETKKPSQQWEDAETTKLILTTDSPQQSLLKLISAIKAQKGLYTRTDSQVVILDPEEADLFKQLGSNDIEFASKILGSFQTIEAKSLLLQLKPDDLTNLYIAIKHAKNKQAVDELKRYIDGEVNETAFQKWIKDNTWVFGTEYVKKFDTRKIGIHSQADFIVESLDGFTDLIELKKSDPILFEKDMSRDCYYPSKDMAQVIGQAVHYIKVMEDHRSILKEEDDLEILKPRVKIVIGRSSELDYEQKKSLRLLNSTLHGIEIITYDEIVIRAEKIISIYESI